MLNSYYTHDLKALNVFGVIEDSYLSSDNPVGLLGKLKRQIKNLEEDLENKEQSGNNTLLRR